MLTRYLMAMQDRLHLSDVEFAGELGLEAETWRALCTGRTGYTPTILARLLLHVPNAHALALEELRLQEHAGALRLLDSAFAAPLVAPPPPAAAQQEGAPALAYVA